MTMPKLTKLAQTAVRALEDLKGVDIKVLDVQHLTTVTDWMIICTGTSNRHVKSLADNVAEAARESGTRPLGMEGTESCEWVLVDLGSVVVHVMQVQARAFYQLEKLWDVAPPEPPPEAAKPAKAVKGGKAAKTAKPAKSARKAVGAATKTGMPKRASLKKTAAATKPRAKPRAKPAAAKAPARKKSDKG